MDTRYLRSSSRLQRGAVRPVTLAIIAVFVLLAVAAWLLIIKPHQDLIEADSGGHPSTPVTATTRTVQAPANVAAMDINQLLAEARKAMNEQRVLAPTGNNAFEFYLKALEKQPGNPVATEALRETFPFAASSAEQAINQRDFDEAQRQIDLLAKADPANYTLTILRSKLDAQRKLLDKQQQQELDQQHQQQLAAQKAAADKAAAGKQAEEQAAQTVVDQQKAQQAAREAAERQAQVAKATTPAAKPAGGESAEQTHAAVLVKSALPRYPPTALRSGQEGWVDLDFTVTAEGNVANVRITDSQPRRVFDRAATDAINQWKFSPAVKDGTPAATSMHRRIEFKLGQ